MNWWGKKFWKYLYPFLFERVFSYSEIVEREIWKEYKNQDLEKIILSIICGKVEKPCESPPIKPPLSLRVITLKHSNARFDPIILRYNTNVLQITSQTRSDFTFTMPTRKRVLANDRQCFFRWQTNGFPPFFSIFYSLLTIGKFLHQLKLNKFLDFFDKIYNQI